MIGLKNGQRHWERKTADVAREPIGSDVAEAGGTSMARRVDLSVAEQVGEWYLCARSTAHDGAVIGAYGQLQSETDRLFKSLCRSDRPQPVRIVFTRCLTPYQDDDELIAAVRERRVLEVTTSAVSRGRLHPYLDCGFGGAFDRFRAIHDFIGHVGPGFGFDLWGEVAAWRTQDRLHGPLARRALATELYGVNCARWKAGRPPELKAMLFGIDR
jgi:hypothetical protein